MAIINQEVTVRSENLTKEFGDLRVVDQVTFSIGTGTCVGLLGPNGAGKTTTMRMIMGQTVPTSGTVELFGQIASRLSRQNRAKIGLVPQDNNLDPDLSVFENLAVYGSYFGIDPAEVQLRVPELLEFVSLENKKSAQVMQLSGGMKRRLTIARALIANPSLIILDEPTTGLDPQARISIWHQLQQLKSLGKTILITTHYMDEAQRLCDHIIMMDHGKILDEGSPGELIQRHVKKHVVEITKPLPEDLEIQEMESLGQTAIIYTDNIDSLSEKIPVEKIIQQRPSNLEDVFLRLAGRHLREV